MVCATVLQEHTLRFHHHRLIAFKFLLRIFYQQFLGNETVRQSFQIFSLKYFYISLKPNSRALYTLWVTYFYRMYLKQHRCSKLKTDLEVGDSDVRDFRCSWFSKFMIPMFVISEVRDRFIVPNYSRALIVYCIFTTDISAGSTHWIYELYRTLLFSGSLFARFRSEALKR